MTLAFLFRSASAFGSEDFASPFYAAAGSGLACVLSAPGRGYSAAFAFDVAVVYVDGYFLRIASKVEGIPAAPFILCINLSFYDYFISFSEYATSKVLRQSGHSISLRSS